MTYYWDGQFEAGAAWQEVLGLNSVAWDVYFVYGPDHVWGEQPSSPDYYMHQLGSLPKDLRLDADSLKNNVQSRL